MESETSEVAIRVIQARGNGVCEEAGSTGVGSEVFAFGIYFESTVPKDLQIICKQVI